MPRDSHTFREQPGDYLAFLGRISPEKRLDRAIEIARQTGRKLKVAAKIYPEERDYFQETIAPLLRESQSFVEFIGEVGGREKDEFLGNAYALLFPIDWPEPFGLVMIEALACGTPVIAWRNGSVPEVIADGVTGFVVNSVEEAVAAVGRVTWLDRPLCRKTFEALRRRPHGPGLCGGIPAVGAWRSGTGTVSVTATRPHAIVKEKRFARGGASPPGLSADAGKAGPGDGRLGDDTVRSGSLIANRSRQTRWVGYPLPNPRRLHSPKRGRTW